MSAEQAAVLETRDLQVFYGPVSAVQDLQLCLPAGRIVSLIGPNGAGKSSALNAIAAALPGNGHSSGEVLLNGESLSSTPIEQRVAKGLCLVPEKRELFGSMSVEDNLLLGSYHLYKKRQPDFAGQLEQVYQLFPRLLERRRQLAATLSGGERQMLALGRALMARPQVLMLDEPSLGLAPRIVQEIFQIIGQLRARGVSILLVEQNARAALQVSDYAYVLEMGRIALQGPAAELLHDQRVIDSYLGVRSGTQDN